MLAVGPVLGACALTQYLYLCVSISLSRVLSLVLTKPQSLFSINIESILTQVVFDHSLRIQLRSDALDNPEETKGNQKQSTEDRSTMQPSGSTTPASESRPDSETPTSGAQTPLPEASTSTSTAASSSETVVAEAVAQPEGGHAKEKAGHLIGKINNLITSDIDEINVSYNLLFIREFFFTRRAFVITHLVLYVMSSDRRVADCVGTFVSVQFARMEVRSLCSWQNKSVFMHETRLVHWLDLRS